MPRCTRCTAVRALRTTYAARTGRALHCYPPPHCMPHSPLVTRYSAQPRTLHTYMCAALAASARPAARRTPAPAVTHACMPTPARRMRGGAHDGRRDRPACPHPICVCCIRWGCHAPPARCTQPVARPQCCGRACSPPYVGARAALLAADAPTIVHVPFHCAHMHWQARRMHSGARQCVGAAACMYSMHGSRRIRRVCVQYTAAARHAAGHAYDMRLGEWWAAVQRMSRRAPRPGPASGGGVHVYDVYDMQQGKMGNRHAPPGRVGVRWVAAYGTPIRRRVAVLPEPRRAYGTCQCAAAGHTYDAQRRGTRTMCSAMRQAPIKRWPFVSPVHCTACPPPRLLSTLLATKVLTLFQVLSFFACCHTFPPRTPCRLVHATYPSPHTTCSPDTHAAPHSAMHTTLSSRTRHTVPSPARPFLRPPHLTPCTSLPHTPYTPDAPHAAPRISPHAVHTQPAT
ncbi:hypothetical protein GGX14DRAFT_559112 [Mycena pura]|uniref:Uncharacterized protein n=1 Tax=Mycena pura TaxID=153505 RepID=A0AAD6VSY2_9AGAR|nr:hypothetical protein GGX14DRAFT_559112 [Mycena pura]